MGRTRRVAIDGGFQDAGNSWYDSGDFVNFPSEGYVTFDLPFGISLGGYGQNYASTVTLWNNGVLSLGTPTQAQIDFFGSGADAIPGADNPGFPGFFFLFDYSAGGFHNSYSYGIGLADYQAPFNPDEAVSAAFFTFDENYQIILDQNGFAFIDEPTGTVQTGNGFFIGGQAQENDGFVADFDYYPDFLAYQNGSYVGSEFNERFYSFPGGNLIDGKEGLDLLSYEASGAGVTVNLLTGAASGGDAEGDQILNIEDLYGSGFADTLTGSGIANKLYGLGGDDTIAGGNANDTIEGGAGADNLDGGNGTDTLSYAGSPQGVTISLEDSTATGGDAAGDVFTKFEQVTGSQFDDLLEASSAGNTLDGQSGDDVILGSTGVDHLYGGYGDDSLTGGAGGDRLDGGYGSDTANYADSGAAVTIALGAMNFSGGDATGDHLFSIENLIGTAFADKLTGSLDVNRLEGAAGNDILHGLGGDDTLLGGAGNDKLYGEVGNDVLLGGNGDDSLIGDDGLDVLSGGAGADTLVGGAGTDILQGDDGNDTLKGGLGADTMTGGGGDDLFIVDNAGDVVIEGSDDGTNDRIQTSVSYTLGVNSYVEQLETSGIATTAAIDLIGNGIANTLIGNDGANVLNGRTGADYMVGNGGDDLFIVDNVGDVVVEHNAGGGYDQVNSAVDFTLPAYVEKLALIGTRSIAATGNALDNIIAGNDAGNVLNGRAGADQMVGNGGDDTYIVDNAGDVVIEHKPSQGYDTVDSSVSYVLPLRVEALVLTGGAAINGTGNAAANSITGNASANVLDGGAGADTLLGGGGADELIGGPGNDTLDGGAGKDVFDFMDHLTAANRDTINGYTVADDVIHLNDTAFAGLPLGALAAGAFDTGTAATDADDRIIYDSASGALYFDPDGTGAAAAVQFATLDPGLAMSAGEFYVI